MPTRFLLPTLVWSFRLFLALLFLGASIGVPGWEDGVVTWRPGKLADPLGFWFQLRNLDLVSDPWNAWIAMGLPWLELLTGIALLVPRMGLGGSTLACGLLLSFIVALASLRARGVEVDCGCFGGAGETSDLERALLWRALWFGMATTCFVVLWKQRPPADSSGLG